MVAAGIKLLDETRGSGRPARRGDEVLFNLRIFLNQGDEVPLNERELEAAGADPSRVRDGRRLLDRRNRLGRRELIAGVEKSLEGMCAGGYRRVRVSPHLAYAERGIPGLIPANAVLEIELWLIAVDAPGGDAAPGPAGIGFQDHFSPLASRYAACRPRYPRELFAYIAAQAPRRSEAWDCATGNGQAAVGLADWFETVAATDASAEQIAHAIGRPNIDYSVQAAEATNFPDRHFDAVLIAQAIHWFDLGRFTAELTRVVAPGGVIIVCGYAFFRIDPEIDEIIRTDILQRVSPYWSNANQRLWRGYKNLQMPFASLPSPEIEMSVNWDLDALLGYMSTWSSMKRAVEAEGGDVLETAATRLREVWGMTTAQRRVDMDFHVLAWRAPSAEDA